MSIIEINLRWTKLKFAINVNWKNQSSCSALRKERKTLKKTSPIIPKNHTCPICKKVENELRGRGGKVNPAFVLDHDHITKKFRGYICQSCNRALGTFHTIELLANAILYLEKTAN